MTFSTNGKLVQQDEYNLMNRKADEQKKKLAEMQSQIDRLFETNGLLSQRLQENESKLKTSYDEYAKDINCITEVFDKILKTKRREVFELEKELETVKEHKSTLEEENIELKRELAEAKLHKPSKSGFKPMIRGVSIFKRSRPAEILELPSNYS